MIQHVDPHLIPIPLIQRSIRSRLDLTLSRHVRRRQELLAARTATVTPAGRTDPPSTSPIRRVFRRCIGDMVIPSRPRHQVSACGGVFLVDCSRVEVGRGIVGTRRPVVLRTAHWLVSRHVVVHVDAAARIALRIDALGIGLAVGTV